MSSFTSLRRHTLIIGVVIAATFALFGTSLEAVAQNGHAVPHATNPPLKFGANPTKLSTDNSAAGQFVPLPPSRILDTRTTGGRLAKQGLATIQVAGRGGVPTGATAVVMNVTVTNTTAPSFLTVWSTGDKRPNSSNLNFVANQSVPNLVKVRLGPGGAVHVYNHEGATDVLFDVAGYYTGWKAPASASKYVPLSPTRILDTRTTGARVGKQGIRSLQVTGRAGVPASATAVIMNVTATDATASSFLTVWPAGKPRPNASNLNYVAGQTVPNQVIVQLGATGAVNIYNHEGSVHVLSDIAGYYTAATMKKAAIYRPLSPRRILDTRTTGAAVGKQGVRNIQVAGRAGVPSNATAVAMNVTAVNATATSFLTAWPTGRARPNASNLNYVAGQTVPNLVIVTIGAGGGVNIYNHEGSVHVLFDVAGYFTKGSGGNNIEIATSAHSSLRAATVPFAAGQVPFAASEAGTQVDLGTRAEAIADLENAELTPLDDGGFNDDGTASSSNNTASSGTAAEFSGAATGSNLAGGTSGRGSKSDPYWAGYLPKRFNNSVGRYYGLFESGGGFLVATCTATVVDTNMIITAAHCVLNGSQTPAYVMFVPGQHGTVRLPPNLKSTKDVWFAKDIFYPKKYPASTTGDYAFLTMRKNAAKNLASKYKPIPFIYGYGNQATPWMWQMGYPAEGYFQDGAGADNSNQGRCPQGTGYNFACDPYSCLSKPGDNSFIRRANGERFARMPCYIAGGASGGPIFGWYKISGEEARWYVMSVVSHGMDRRFGGNDARPGDAFVDTPGCNWQTRGLRECLWYGTSFYMPIFDNTTNQLYQQAAAG